MTELFALEWAGNGTLLSIVLAVALLESLAIVGLLLPGVALLFILASAAANQHIAFHWLLIAASIGAFIGDSLSFFLGRQLKSKLLQWPPIQKRPKLFQRSQNFCQKHGLKSLLIGRFIGPLRPIVPMTAGALEFPVIPFIMIALIGAILWAPVYLGPGYYIGSWPGLNTSHWIIIFALLAIPEAMLGIQKHIASSTKNQLMYSFYAFALVLIMGSLLYLEKSTAKICELLCGANTTTILWLKSSTDLITQQHYNYIDLAAQTISNTGNSLPIFCMLGFVFWQLQRRGAFHAAFILLLASGLPFLLKTIFDIDRPPGEHIELTQSFPSGHTYFAFLVVACAQLLGYLQHKLIRRLAIYWAFAVALSRIVLGAHWPLDILGGYLLALSSSYALYWVFQKEGPKLDN